MANKFQLAEAFTEFTIKGFTLFKSQMLRAKGLATAVAAPFLKLGGIIGKAFSPLKLGLGAVAGGAGIFGLLKLASTAEEVRNRFRLVFDDMAENADDFTIRLGKQLRQNTTELRDSMAAYQGYFVGLKIGNKTATELSKTMLRLQLDFQSVADLSTTETQEKLLSTLSGMALPMRKYGVDIQEAAIQQELLAAGLDKTTAGASRQAKALAAMKILIDTMQRQKTIGDLPRTMGSMANQARAMLAMFKELGETLGNFLTPIFKELANLASAFAEVFARAAEGALPKVEGILESIGKIIRGVAEQVRNLDFARWKEGVTGIWNSVIEGFGGAFLLIMEAAADILFLAGEATGKAIFDGMRGAAAGALGLTPIPNRNMQIAEQLRAAGMGADADRFDAAANRRGAGGAALGRSIAARMAEVSSAMALLAKQRTRGLGATIKDEFGNLLTKGAQAQVEESGKEAAASLDLIARLLDQLVEVDARAAPTGQGAFAAVGFASLQRHMQNIISKGEEEAIKLAKRAEVDRGKIFGVLEDIFNQPQPAPVGP